MKSLRQLREEVSKYDPPARVEAPLFEDQADADKKEDKEETASQKISKEKKLGGIPNAAKMPLLIMFRRTSYKIFPGKQTVALYYAKSIDKYLSIPFGPGGNVNLSEAAIVEDDDPVWADDIREDRLNENPLAAVAGAVGNYIKGKAVQAAAGAVLGGKSNDPTASQTIAGERKLGGIKSNPKIKTGSFKGKGNASAANQAILKNADLKTAKAPIKENKMADLRQMIKEGIEFKDLSINGKVVTLNTNMAKRILEVYDGVNAGNKKLVEGMLNKDLESFKKLLNFSIRN